MATTLPHRPRWQALARFVGRFYEAPLGAGMVSEAEVRARVEQAGGPVPTVVAEWFRLVGGRLMDVNQDRAVRLESLTVRDGWIVLWVENQGNWWIEACAESSEDDPKTRVGGMGAATEWNATVTEALLGMAVSDSLIAAAVGSPHGPLGSFHPEVVGGNVDAPDAAAQVDALDPLDIVLNPYFEAPMRGDDSLIIRPDGPFYTWMAADPDAELRANQVFEVSATRGPQQLVIRFTDVEPGARSTLRVFLRASDDFSTADAPVRLSQYSADFSSGAVRIESDDPTAAFARVRALVPDSLLPFMSAGHRPEHTARFVPCWPPDATSFRAPGVW